METKCERIYRWFLYLLLIACTAGMVAVFHYGVRMQTPDAFLIRKDRMEEIHFQLPVTATIRAADSSLNGRTRGMQDEGERNENEADANTMADRAIRAAAGGKIQQAADIGKEQRAADEEPLAGIGYDRGRKDAAVKVKSVMGANDIRKLSFENRTKEVRTPLGDTIQLKAGSSPYYIMDVKVLGIVPLKRIALQTATQQTVMVSGQPIGIYVKTRGVLVIDTGSFLSQVGAQAEPAGDKLMSGDYILYVNGKKAENKRQIIREVEESEGEELVFTILRGGEVSDVSITPVKNEQGVYKAGIWIRDSAQGIGTLTFVTEKGEFAALGHGINDYDTGKLLEIERGSIYDTEIISVTKGNTHAPGQITGVLTLDDSDYLGAIRQNTEIGIYGQLDEEGTRQDNFTETFVDVPIGYKQEIKKGKAQVYSNVSGTPQLYDADILDVYYRDLRQNQGILLEITDERLLDYTGGIVQGMSGSPILQDGKLIGAVTHVFLNDPTKGYGIFIEEMLTE